MIYDFDTPIDRRRSESEKWNCYPADVLPLWVADMDFRSPEPVIEALRQRVDHGVFGYSCDPVRLREVVVERLWRLYGWQVAPDALILLPGVVQGFNLVCRALGRPGEEVLVQPPVYSPILKSHAQAGLRNVEVELVRSPDGCYSLDLDAFEQAISERTRLFILCNPHNPVGRVFRYDELKAMAEICLRHKILICSDEIHCDIVYNGQRHMPIASIAPEVEQQTVTLIAPSKTFNIAGLRLALAIVPNPELRKRLVAVQRPLMGSPSILSVVAALAAYKDGQEWLDQALAYLQANRDYLFDYVHTHLPMIYMIKPEATFLGWLDCREAGISGNDPYRFFLDKAKVALNDGAGFGRGGQGFVRLNFGCPRSTLTEALERMRQAVATL